MRLKAFNLYISQFNQTSIIMHNDPKTPEDIIVLQMHPAQWARLGGKGKVIMTLISEDE